MNNNNNNNTGRNKNNNSGRNNNNGRNTNNNNGRNNNNNNNNNSGRSNKGKNNNNGKNWGNNGGRGDGRSRGQRKGNAGNERGDRGFTKFVDMDRNNQESEYWPQAEWNYNNEYDNHITLHDNNNYSNVGGGYGGNVGIFPWQRRTPANPLIIPPVMPTVQHPIINDTAIDNEVSVNNMSLVSGSENNIQQQQPLTPQRNQHQNAFKSPTSRSRNNSITSNNNLQTDNTPATVVTNDDPKPAAVATTVPPSPVKSNLTIKIKQEKQDTIKLKQERKSSSSSSSSSSEESSSSDEEPEPPKKSEAIVASKIAQTAVPDKSETDPLLNIKLKPQQKAKTKVPPVTAPAPKLIAAKKGVAASSSSSSSSSSEEEEQAPPPSKLPSKPVSIAKATPVKKQEPKGKSAKKKNSSEDDVVCMGKLENKIVLEDDDDDDDDEDEDSDSEDEMEELNKSIKSDKKSMKTTKKSEEICMICDKKGHTSFQCQMICKNCSAPYHGFRTCPQPANLNTMLQLFMEFCMQQLQNFKPDTATSMINDISVPKPQVGSPSTTALKTNNKSKRKRVKTKETNAKLKSMKKRKLSNIKRRKSEDDDDDEESVNSSTDEEEDDSDDSSSSSDIKRKLKNSKSKNSSMSAFNLANFIPNNVNLPLVLNGFPNLTAAPTNTSKPNTSSNALNTLLLTQMLQNAIGTLK